jgi:phage tail-like protein
MTFVSERMYRFDLAAQWEAGVRRNLELRGDRLVVPDQLVVEPIPGAGRAEAGALPAVDACGRLMWLRPSSRQLVRRPLPGSQGVIELGTLDDPDPARRVLAGPTLIWVVAGQSLDRHSAATLQRLSPVEAPAGWRVCDAAGDGGDGLWATEVDTSGRWRLRHVDCWGRTCRPPIAVSGPDGGELAITSTENGHRLVVIDPVRSETAHVVDAATGIVDDIGLDPIHLGRPTLLAAGPGDRVHLLTVLAEASADRGERAMYQALNLRGDVEDHQELEVPPSLGRLTALAGGAAGLVVACSRGVAEIKPRQGGTGERRSTFITPALVSPLGPRSGWSRAEIDAVLPAGTAMDVAWASTDDAWLISQAANLFAGPVTARLVDELEELLPWRDDEMVTYLGTSGAVAVEELAAPVDGATGTTLWLRVRLHTPPGRTPPAVVGLRVRYPDVSYLDDLPAIYREHASAARELRRVLAPYELLFDGLDQALASLPDRIDPATARDDWTDYLLSWLGFPPLGDLPARLRQELLEQAAVVLGLRGTRQGLQLLLELVTEGRASVTDSAEEPPGWFLGAADVPSAGATPARLGFDTISLAQQPESSRPGSMIAGRTPLGRGCPDPGLMLARRAGTVTVTVELDRDQQRDLRPVIDRLLPVFVPAHCRLRVVYTAADAADRSRQLDVDFRLGPGDPAPEAAHGHSAYDALLHSDAHWRLGATTWLGGWSLPEPRHRAAVLDHGAPLGAGQRLH